MNDMISRQAAIDAIRASALKYTGFMEMEMYTDDDAVEAINGVPSAQQWIPCSERLPSDGENVLLCSTLFGKVAIGKLIRYNTSCCWEVDHWDCDIEDWQAWMRLPEPWRGEEDE